MKLYDRVTHRIYPHEYHDMVALEQDESGWVTCAYLEGEKMIEVPFRPDYLVEAERMVRHGRSWRMVPVAETPGRV